MRVRHGLLALFIAVGISVALGCGAAEQPTPQAPATPLPAAQPPSGPTVTPAQPATPLPAPTAAPAVTQVAPTATRAPQPTATPVRAVSTPSPAQVKRGGHLNMGSLEREFTNLNPATVNQVRQFQLTRQVISGLTVFDQDLAPRPELAESWSVSSDGLTWTFKIRPNAKFSTGRDYTADDVIFSYDNTLDPATQSIHTKGLEGVSRPVKVDDKTVQISTAVPRASMLTKVVEGTSGRVLTAIDREQIAKEGQAGFNRVPVGAGWFKVKSHVFGERLELEKNPFYWDIQNRPILDSVTVFNILEGATLVAALKSRQLDFVESYPVQFYKELSQTPGIVIDDTPDIGFQMVGFNRRGDRMEKIGKSVLPTDDVRVRRAVGNALDRDELINKGFQGRAIPAYGPVPPAQKLYFVDQSKTSLQRFNLPEAKRLLTEAAAEKGAELGFTANGFDVKMMTDPANRVPAEVVVDMLRRNLGVNIELQIFENATLQPRYQRGEWEWWLGGSGGDPDPDDSVDDWFADGSKFNSYGYNNARVNELNFLQKTATDIEQRKKYLLEIQEILTNDMPGAFVYHFLQSNAYWDYVKGYVHVPALADLDTVWLDK